jgi:hypothetical protein
VSALPQLGPAERLAAAPPPEPEPFPHRVVFISPAKGWDEWRCHWPAQSLIDSGWEVKVLALGSKDTYDDMRGDDVVVIHALNQDIGINDLVSYTQPHVGKIVLDFDDDYAALKDIQPVGLWYADLYSDIAAACSKADAITVATPPLVSVYRKWCDDVQVCRNYMPRRYEWLLDTTLRPRRVGWMGLVGPDEHMPHRADMIEVRDAGLLDGLELWAAGDAARVRTLFSERLVDDDPIMNQPRTWVDGTGPLGPEVDLYSNMTPCRVAIAPLVENTFNRSKSWIKPLEFAYQGVPSVLPAWHPAFNEFASLGIPCQLYTSYPQAREQIDRVLAMPDAEWEALSFHVKRTAMFACDERMAGETWRNTMWRIAG